MFEAMDGEGEFGQRLRSFLGCWNGREDTVLLEAAFPLEATVVIEQEAAAARKARLDLPCLTIFTDGARLENGATGYAAVWKKGNDWDGLKSHMHGLGTGSLRLRVRGPRQGPPSGSHSG